MWSRRVHYGRYNLRKKPPGSFSTLHRMGFSADESPNELLAPVVDKGSSPRSLTQGFCQQKTRKALSATPAAQTMSHSATKVAIQSLWELIAKPSAPQQSQRLCQTAPRIRVTASNLETVVPMMRKVKAAGTSVSCEKCATKPTKSAVTVDHH